MVEATGPGPPPGGNERVEQRGCELAQLVHAVAGGEAQQQAQRRFLGLVLASQRPLVGEEVSDSDAEVVVHASASSPSSSPTSRSASTATLA